MNTNMMELNLDELEMISGGDVWDRVKGALVGAAVGCVGTTVAGFIAAGPFGAAAGAISGTAGGAIGGAMAGYDKMVIAAAYFASCTD